MKEKNKTNLMIIILILIIILGLICYQLIKPQEELEKNNEIINQNIIEDEKQEIEIQDNKIATQNIKLNGNDTEVKVTMDVDDIQQSEHNVYTTYTLELKIEVNHKVAEKIEDFRIELDGAEELQLKNIVKSISKFIGEDNKEYIMLLLENYNTYTNVYQNYYIIDENAKFIGKFKNDRAAGIMLDDYSGDYVQVYENYIIEYKIDENDMTLKKWKNTVNDGKIKEVLEKEYSEDEYT